jgi:hypothetical protein
MISIGRIVIRLLALFSFFCYSWKIRAGEWVEIRLLRRHKQIVLLKESDLNLIDRFAVLALFPRTALLPSVKRLVELLKRQGYSIVAIINESSHSERWVAELEIDLDVIIKRPNIGRDFGAYQCGIRYLESRLHLEKPHAELLLVNDSVYYTPKAAAGLRDFFGSPSDWKSLFINFQFHLHAQSFFVSFAGKVLSDRKFREFWKKYYPTSIRHNVINKGEIALSRTLLSRGFSPDPFVTAERLEQSLSVNPELKLFEKFGVWSEAPEKYRDLERTSPQLDIFRLRQVLDLKNPTHQLGLLSARLLGTPLKLDLMKTALCTFADFRECMLESEVSEEEWLHLRAVLIATGTSNSVQGLPALWRRYGLV